MLEWHDTRDFKLADRRGMNNLIPIVPGDETKQIKADIEGRNVSWITVIIFDGTTRFGEALAITVSFVIECRIDQRLVRFQLLVKSMTGEEIAREIVNTLSVEMGFRLSECWHPCEIGPLPVRWSLGPYRSCTVMLIYWVFLERNR